MKLRSVAAVAVASNLAACSKQQPAKNSSAPDLISNDGSNPADSAGNSDDPALGNNAN